MSVMEHLGELRTRLIISAAAIGLGAVVAFAAYEPILDLLKGPYCDVLPPGEPCKLVFFDPLEGFTTRLKVATYGGLVLALPVVLLQFWRFVTPGLNPNEKRYAVPFVASSMALFCLGAVLGFFTLPKALDFLLGIGGDDLQAVLSASKYLRFVILIEVAFGVAFLFPVVLVFLEIAGALSSAKLRGWRRQAIVGIVVAAAVITPSQDPYSLLFMAGPMYIFYEASIVIGRLMKK